MSTIHSPSIYAEEVNVDGPMIKDEIFIKEEGEEGVVENYCAQEMKLESYNEEEDDDNASVSTIQEATMCFSL